MGKHSRKAAAILLALGLALGFAACREKAASSQPAAQENPDKGSSLRILRPGDEQGHYQTNYSYKSQHQRISYIDYASGKETVLCASPNCMHSDESCTAWTPQDRAAVYILDEEHILIYGTDQDKAALGIADRDGSNYRSLIQEASGWDSIQRMEYADFLADDTYVYYLYRDPEKEMQRVLCRVPQAGGEPEKLFVWDKPDEEQWTPPTVLGVTGRQMILWYSIFDEEEQNSSFDLSEDVSPEEALKIKQQIEQQHQEQKSECQTIVCAIDVDTQKETLLLDRKPGEKSITAFWKDAKLYWMERDRAETLNWITLDGLSGQRAIQWPQSIMEHSDCDMMLERAMGNLLLVQARSVNYEWDNERMALDPAQGTTTLLKLKCLSNGNLIPLPIQAVNQNQLLVEIDVDNSKQQVVEQGPDGVPVQADIYIEHLGLLSFEDYLASRPNYQEIIRLPLT